MSLFFYALVVLSVFVVMETVAWFTHKYVMHGFLWVLHEDHHRPHTHFFEKNDLFFLIFAVPSATCLMMGTLFHVPLLLAIGLGIMLYGICYFLVHDVLIHRRFKFLDNLQNPYFMALRKAHKIHHKNQEKEEAACFGMLLVPLRFYKEAYQMYKNKKSF